METHGQMLFIVVLIYVIMIRQAFMRNETWYWLVMLTILIIIIAAGRFSKKRTYIEQGISKVYNIRSEVATFQSDDLPETDDTSVRK